MIYTSFFPYFRSKNAFTLAEHMGSFVAHTELPLMALRHGVVDGLCLIASGLPSKALPEERHAAERAVQELQEEFGKDRIQVRNLVELPTILSNPRHLFVEKASLCLGLLQTRNASAAPVATCGLLHTLFWPDMLQTWLSMQFLIEPQDAMVVPCDSARRTVEELIRQTESLIATRVGTKGFRSGIHVETIPYGVDLTAFQGIPKEAARQMMGVPQDRVILLWFGRLDEGYKADLLPLLHSASLAQANGLDLHLILAGSCLDPNYPTRLMQSAASMGMAARLSMHFNVSPAEKRALFSSADIFISPVDNIQESYGISLLEAMASGLPVIASDWSGYRDLVQNDITGVLVPTTWNPEAGRMATILAPLMIPPGTEAMVAQMTEVDIHALSKAIQTLVENPDTRSRMGALGRERVKARFSWEAVIPRFASLWKKQREDAHPLKPISAKRGFFDFDRVFSPYATARLNPGMTVHRTDHGDAILKNHASAQDPRFRNPTYLRTLQLLKEPLTISELSKRLGMDALGTVGWLAKMGGVGTRPSSVHCIRLMQIEVSSKCNLKCKSCRYWTAEFFNETKNKKELDTENILQFIDKSKTLNVENIILCNGEPFLRSDVLDIAAYSKAKYPEIAMGIISNGTLITDTHIDKMIDIGLDTLTISIDGIGQTHDEIRGKDGTFEKARSAIYEIQELKKIKGKDNPKISITTVINKCNVSQISKLVQLGKELRVSSMDFRLATFLDTDTARETNRLFDARVCDHHHYALPDDYDVSLLTLDDQSIERLNQELNALKNIIGLNILIPFSPDKEYITNGKTQRFKCDRPWDQILINNFGEIFTCGMLPGNKIGTVFESMNSIVNSDNAIKLREFIRTKYLPICDKCCSGPPLFCVDFGENSNTYQDKEIHE
jgi:MoaA/NifB/PqqE/SkfB family radical SAM enzyme/glycosyltransferase involved in cell wall biosynthesis